MFRNVSGAQEAIVYRQLENKFTRRNAQTNLIKDTQSDEISQTYSTIQLQWNRQREQLTDHLQHLEQHNTSFDAIQHFKSLITCFNELIDNGQITAHCQTVFKSMNEHIQLFPERYKLTPKPLGDKMIRLPRHITRARSVLSNPLEKQTSDTTEIQESVESLSRHTSEKLENERQFFNIVEVFRRQIPQNHSRTTQHPYLSDI